ncbi:TSUP family transporter [Desulfococcaceae bacterium HSG8]|nr:TSUP family transporter [Desulfococcaceae bacterium HSG8]
MEIGSEIIILLFCTGLAAGFVDSIAGGGGLLALPVLLSAGLPPQIALGTNKFQGTFGTLSSSYNFIRKGKVNLRECFVGILYTLIGAALGAWIVQLLAPGFLKHMVPILLFLVLIYTIFSKNLGYEEQPPIMGKHAFYLIFGTGLGFYDGFFGPGTGSFWMAGCCIFLGVNMTRSAGISRVMNLTSNVAALSVFIIGGNVRFPEAICMGLGQLIGARIGSNLAIQKGASFIRPVFMAVVAATVIRLVCNNYFS